MPFQKKPGGSGNDSEPLSFRIKRDLRAELEAIADYEHAQSMTELLRGWIRERTSDYRDNSRFVAWKKLRDSKYPPPGQVMLAT